MNPEIKARWVAALRSGDYPQGCGELRSRDNKFCCIGVLSDLYAKEHGVEWEMGATGWELDNEQFFFPDAVSIWAGIGATKCGLLMHIDGRLNTLPRHNDGDGCPPATFAQIADAIEEQL